MYSKPGNWNFGGVAIVAHKQASGVWKEEKRVGKSPTYCKHFCSTMEPYKQAEEQ